MDSLFTLASAAWRHYADLRKRRAALDLAARVPFFVDEAHRPFEQIRRQAEAAQYDVDPSPYIPPAPPPSPESVAGNGWQWGYTTAIGIADAAAEVLRTALGLASAEDLTALSAAVEEVARQRSVVTAARQSTDGIWETDPALHGLTPDRSYWRFRLLAYRRAVLGLVGDDEERLRQYAAERGLPDATLGLLLARDGGQGRDTRTAVVAIVETLVGSLDRVGAVAASRLGSGSPVLRAWLPMLTLPDGERADQVATLLQRLLALDVAVWLVADGPATGTSLPIKLLQLSLQTTHPWVVHSTAPDDKAAGMGLARFGGFLKRSWRMNDWFWGRLDAAAVLCRMVLDPERLRRVGMILGADRLDPTALHELARLELTTLTEGLLGDEPLPPEMARLHDAALKELADALGDHTSAPQLPSLAAFAAYPLQARIALEELPVIASAIAQDRVEGASPRSRGERFLAGEAGLCEEVRTHIPGGAGWLALGSRALVAFDAAGVGREPLGDEAGSDALVRTTTKAAGSMATLVDSPRFGVKAIRPVTSAIRGAALLPYWIVNGLAGGAPLARFLATLGLVAGALLLALGLFGVLGWAGPVGGLVGAATMLAAVGYSALRTGSLLHGVALLGPVVPLVAFALDSAPDTDGGNTAGGLIAVLVLVAALYLLGRMPWPLRSPRALTHTEGFQRAVRRWVTAVAIAGLVVLAWVAGSDAWHRHGNRSLAIALSVAALALGWLLADRCSRGLRRWRPGAESVRLRGTPRGSIAGPFLWEPVDDPHGVAASWAAVYGAVYLGAAWVLTLVADSEGGTDPRTWNWVSAALAAWSVLAVVLLLVAPILLSRRSWRRSRDLVQAGGPLVDDTGQELLRRLVQLDAASWHFCRPTRGRAGPSRATATAELSLTGPGQRLREHLALVSARRAGVPTRRGTARPRSTG